MNAEKIRRLIKERNLIRNFVSIDKQITPNGFDLTVEKVFDFIDQGSIGFSNENRILSRTKELEWENDSLGLERGCYKIRTNEIIKMPLDLVGIALPRSSLLRSGVTVDTGVWDAGFEGKSEFLLMVENNNGFRIWKNARVVQIIFTMTKRVKEGYCGIYKSLG